MRYLPIVVLALAFTAGCGDDVSDSPTASIDPVELVRILPTPAGLTFDAASAKQASAADVQEALAGSPSTETAAKFESELGFVNGAVRSWSGPEGAALTVVVSRWPSHDIATNVGGGAAEFPLRAGSATGAWTPKDLPGARGSRTEPGPGSSRSLAFAVADVSLFVRGDGAIGDEVVIRTLSRLTRPVLAVAGPRANN